MAGNQVFQIKSIIFNTGKRFLTKRSIGQEKNRVKEKKGKSNGAFSDKFCLNLGFTISQLTPPEYLQEF